jgi:ankyrin repeat protein
MHTMTSLLPLLLLLLVLSQSTNPVSANPGRLDHLYRAVHIHDLSSVLGILNFRHDHDSVELNRVDSQGRTHFHICGLDPQSKSKPVIDITCARILSALLAAKGGANPSRGCHEGWRPLDVYASLGLPETVAALLDDSRVDVNAVSRKGKGKGRTALIWASINGNAVCVDVLLQAGADPNLGGLEGEQGEALLLAVRNQVMKKVALDRKVDTIGDSNEGEKSDAEESLYKFEALLDSGKLVDSATVGAESPSSGTCNIDVSSTNFDDTVNYGCEPGKEYLIVISHLLAAGADVNVLGKSGGGKTPIMLAAMAGDLEVVEMLLNTGRVDLQVVDEAGFGAISYARSEEIRNKLIDYLTKSIK